MVKVLIVDDSVIIRRNLKDILTRLNYKVVGEASNGKEALEKYIICNPDIVTMDISMPGTDGITATIKILDRFPNATIIIVSALNQRTDVLKAINAGAKYYIVKPFSELKIKEVFEQVLTDKK
jgi:two-component system chemotaxis response regulator CheY